MKIKVYQIDSDRDNRRLGFMGYDFTEKHGGINPADYKCVFDGYIDAMNLENVYATLNSDERPGTYRGHSLSVSDIVEVTGDIQPDWDRFAGTPFGQKYFAARLAVNNAFSQTLSDDMSAMPGIITMKPCAASGLTVFSKPSAAMVLMSVSLLPAPDMR